MASKKKMAAKKKIVKSDGSRVVEESGPVVAVVFRRSFTGYPKAGEQGYIDADLFPIWEAKGHVYREAAKTPVKRKVPPTDNSVEVDDEVDSEGEPGTDQSGDNASVYGGFGA